MSSDICRHNDGVDGDAILAVHATTADPDLVEICSAAGADAYVVDLEHGSASFDACVNAIRAGETFGTTLLFRTPLASLHDAARLLDAGAGGVIVADILDARDCARSVEAIFHPPLGRRGFGGCRENRYGLEARGTIDGREPLVGVQIERGSALMNLDKILSVSGIGIVSVGTRDLAADFGYPGQMQHPEVNNAVRTVAEAAHQRGIAFAHMVRSADQVPEALQLGASWLLIPLAALVRTGIEAFRNAPGADRV